MRWLLRWGLILAGIVWVRAQAGVYLVNHSSRICQVQCLDRTPGMHLRVQVSDDPATDHVRTWLGPALDEHGSAFELPPHGGRARIALADEKDAGQPQAYRFAINGPMGDLPDNILIYRYQPAGLKPAVDHWESPCPRPRADIVGRVSLINDGDPKVRRLIDTPWQPVDPADLEPPAASESCGWCCCFGF